MPDATIRLQAAPATAGTPTFGSGCANGNGNGNGKSSCVLGTLDAGSARRQFHERLTVPVTATAVTSVRLTVTGSAAHLPKDPAASASVSITAPPAVAAPGGLAGAAGAPPDPATITSPLPVGSLPSIPAAAPTLSPGGNAASLFPTLAPKPTRVPVRRTGTRPVANTSALPEGAGVIGAQVAGLAALALAFVLAVTRLSIRRPPAPPQGPSASPPQGPPASSGTGSTPTPTAAPPPPDTGAKPPDQPGPPEQPSPSEQSGPPEQPDTGPLPPDEKPG